MVEAPCRSRSLRPTRDPAERWLDRVTIDGTWPGNVFSFFRRVFPKLTADLKVPFRLDAEMKRIDSTSAHEALREALVNALVHADYSGTRGIRVFKRRTSFELVNPGTLRVRWEDAKAGNSSDPRNPTLQKLFQLAGFGDRAGSGIPRILQAWHEQHWRPPNLVENFETNEATLILPMESLLPDLVLGELEERFGDRFRALPEPERIALVTAAAEGKITNRRLQQVLDHHPRDLTFMLGDLVRNGFVVPHGERSGRWYTLTPQEDPSARSERSSEQSSEQSRANSEQSSEQSSEQTAFVLGQPPASQQDPAALVRTKSWADRAEVERAIIHLCQGNFVDLPTLADRLGRAASTVRTHYLSRMLKGGLIELRYPDNRNHPHQAYRAINPPADGGGGAPPCPRGRRPHRRRGRR